MLSVSGSIWVFKGKTTEYTTKSLFGKEKRNNKGKDNPMREEREGKREGDKEIRKRKKKDMIYMGHIFSPWCVLKLVINFAKY